LRGKRVVDRGEFIDKIRAANAARDGRDFFIVARTDALASHGMNEAIARVESAREAGADGSFVEAPTTREELAEIGRRSPAPNVANMIVGGRTPVLSKDELSSLGFQLILHPLAGLYAAAKAIQQVYRALRSGEANSSAGNLQMSFAEFNELIGVEEKYALAQKFGVE
jgi:2-methylisocitrate lyase-like PEP mutase family enzyme